jgi:hypothetical protein
VVVEGRVQTRADSVLAQLISLQQNQGSRLLPILRGPDTVLSLHGSIAWQGQLDRMGQKLASAVHAQVGERWTSAVEDVWRESWAARDRNGAFAVACDMAPRETGPGADLVVKMAVEQPQAAEQVIRTRQLAEIMAPIVDASFPAGTSLSHDFSDAALDGLPGFRHLVSGTAAAGPVLFDHVLLATGHHLLSVMAADGSAAKRIADLAPKVESEGGQKPEGAAAMIALTYAPAIPARAEILARNGPSDQSASLAPAPILAWIKSTPQGEMTVHLELPLIALAVVERETRPAPPPSATPAPRPSPKR